MGNLRNKVEFEIQRGSKEVDDAWSIKEFSFPRFVFFCLSYLDILFLLGKLPPVLFFIFHSSLFACFVCNTKGKYRLQACFVSCVESKNVYMTIKYLILIYTYCTRHKHFLLENQVLLFLNLEESCLALFFKIVLFVYG